MRARAFELVTALEHEDHAIVPFGHVASLVLEETRPLLVEGGLPDPGVEQP